MVTSGEIFAPITSEFSVESKNAMTGILKCQSRIRIAVRNGWLKELIRKNKLVGGQFEGIELVRADLRGANRSSTNLRRADLTLAKMQGARLGLAHLQGAFLTGRI